MSNDLVLKEKESIILEKTPRKYIKKREGRGGRVFDYVEVGYVISKLNELTGYNWSFSIVSKERIDDSIIVLGKLTLHTKSGDITKEQFGSGEIKKKSDGKPIDIADDFKSAASDALKKCASLLGIAQDVYWKQEREDIGQGAEKQEKKEGGNKIKIAHTIFTSICKKLSIKNPSSLWKMFLTAKFGKSSSKEMNDYELDLLVSHLRVIERMGDLSVENLYEKLGVSEEVKNDTESN